MKKPRSNQTKHSKLQTKFDTGGATAASAAGAAGGGMPIPYAQAGNILGDMTTALFQGNSEAPSTEGAVAGGALKGAGMGAALGPWGAAGGAVLGAGMGLITGNKQSADYKKKQAELEAPRIAARNAAYNQSLAPQIQYQPTFAKGGIAKYPDGTKTTDPLMQQVGTPVDPYHDLLGTARQDILKGGIDNPALYEDENAPTKYYTALKGGDAYGPNNPYTQRFKINYNNAFPDHALDPNAAGLQPLISNKPWTNIPSSAVDTTATKTSNIDYNNPQKYNLKSNPQGHALGNGVYGVGNQKYDIGGFTGGARVNKPTDTTKTVNKPYQVGNAEYANAELEDGEPYRTPNGDMNVVDGKTHKEGGEQFNLPQDTEILGKNVSSTGKTYKEEGEKVAKEYEKYRKILEKKPTSIVKRSAQMMMDKLQGKYTNLMKEQEANKPQEVNQQFAYGGMTKYAYGDITDPQFVSPQQQQFQINPYTDEQPESMVDLTNPYAGNALSTTNNYNPYEGATRNMSTTTSQPINWKTAGKQAGSALNTLGTYAPIIYNAAQGLFGKAKQLDPNQFANPYENQINNLMSNRKYDVNPELEANKLATANYNANLRGAAPSQAQYLAGMQAGQIAQQRGAADVYGRANNVNNQYRAEQAQSLSGLGQQRANTAMTVNDINTRAKAMQAAYLPTALSQWQQAAQVNKQMQGQQQNDAIRQEILKGMFKNYGFNFTNPQLSR